MQIDLGISDPRHFSVACDRTNSMFPSKQVVSGETVYDYLRFSQLSEDEEDQCVKIFMQADIDGNGELDEYELLQICQGTCSLRNYPETTQLRVHLSSLALRNVKCSMLFECRICKYACMVTKSSSHQAHRKGTGIIAEPCSFENHITYECCCFWAVLCNDACTQPILHMYHVSSNRLA